jgi:hypothetical protein|tara:strand:+ start:1449 stop:1679 length:231 start_codon:yes stop_codon:yes gene_type:complete
MSESKTFKRMNMINLSISDPIDGFDKIGELRAAIGQDYCGDNKLVSVSKDGNRCIVLRGGVKVSEPSWLTWNRMFY